MPELLTVVVQSHTTNIFGEHDHIVSVGTIVLRGTPKVSIDTRVPECTIVVAITGI